MREDHDDLKDKSSSFITEVWDEKSQSGYVKINTEKPKYHFSEDLVIDEIIRYIDSTYSQHYVGENDIQAFDLISASGHGEGFSIGNIIKLASRYGKKEGKNRKDLLKIAHYAVMLLHLNSKEHKDEFANKNT